MVAGRNYFQGLVVVALFSSLPWLVACTPSGPDSTPASASASAPVAMASAEGEGVAAAGTGASPASGESPKLVKGIYTWGAEVETLSPCNTDKTYWLEGREELLAPLQDLAMKKADAANEAYQPIYVEAQVVYAGKATDGFAVDYDGVMQLQAVQTARSNVPPECKLLDVAASAAE